MPILPPPKQQPNYSTVAVTAAKAELQLTKDGMAATLGAKDTDLQKVGLLVDLLICRRNPP
jgi:hypothetical protein